MATLNLGCGTETYGDVRVDLYKTQNTTLVAHIDHNLPFRDETFDEVYSRCLLEHLRNPFAALSEMKRVCKKGGRIVVVTDNAGYPTHYIREFYGDHVGTYKPHGPEDRHYAVFTREHLKNLAFAAGLSPVTVEFLPGAGGLSLVTRLIRKIPLAREMAYPWVKLVALKI